MTTGTTRPEASAAVPAAGPGEASPSGAASRPGVAITALPVGSRILHIGPPKTGTTALQAAFHRSRRDAEAQGVHYAGRGRHAMTAVLAGTGRPSPWSSARRVDRGPWNRLVGEIRRSRADRVVLSSEFFAEIDTPAIRRVVDDLDPGRVRIVVTLRPLARILPSQWQQYVQNQLALPFDDWLHAMLDGAPTTVTPSFWRRHRHDEVIARWAEVVGRDRLTVVVLDDAVHDHVLHVFEGLTGLRPGTLQADPDLDNRSLTLPEAELIRSFNEAYHAESLSPTLYQHVMRFGAALHLHGRHAAPDEARVVLPAWSLEPVAAAARSIADGIAALGVPVIGDPELLLAVPAAGPPSTPRVAIPADVGARAALGVLLASGLARASTAGAPSGDEARVAAGASDDRPPPLPARRPVAEPYELARVPTLQLGLVILRRWRAAAATAMGRLRGRP